MLAFVGWRIFLALKEAEDPGRFISRWAITAVLVGIMVWVGAKMIGKDQAGTIVGMLGVAFCAMILGVMWTPSWCDILLKPLTGIIDGGDEAPESKPLYSSAEAKRGRNMFQEAINDASKQLEKFPNDFRGLMLIASIKAEDLNDFSEASRLVHFIADSPNETEAHRVAALQQLADWHLKIERDARAAQRVLEKIPVLFPNSRWSQVAAERIARLESTQEMIDNERTTVALPKGQKYVGLRKASVPAPEISSSPLAQQYVEQLQKHPLDTQTRENLAMEYANTYQRLDMASAQIEELIALPNQSSKQIVRWLNLLADLQVRFQDIPAAQTTLKRIQVLFPNSAASENAMVRMAYMGMEAKKFDKGGTVKMAVAQKDMGLKKK